ncbi:hypothetical protein ACFL6X_06570 [Candidatus Latescibacterota bacterium]
MKAIKAQGTGSTPAWAIKQRRVIDAMGEAAELFRAKYVHRGGTLRSHGKLDDDLECFSSWPLLYIMGGDERLLDWSLESWNGITRQWTYQHSQAVHREFMKHNDMLHLSEGYVGFQNFGLAHPFLPENVDRAARFARFYTGDDPEAPNYDRNLKLLRSPFTGSGGPQFASGADYVLIWGHGTLYPVVEELEEGWEKVPERHGEIQRIYDEVMCRGDVPMNLAITGLVTHAHILTGEERFREWVLEYVDAWMVRTEENGGIIPDNVGLSGKIGETRKGQWWGGFFGWSGRYSVWMIFHALATATESAYLLSRDPKYLAFYRSQLDALLGQGIVRDGNLLVPYKMGPEGWHDFRPMDPYVAGHLWHLSMADGDWQRLERLWEHSQYGPHAYGYAESPDPPPPGSEEWRPEGLFDWNHVHDDLSGNKYVENEPAHLRWLAGDNPGWPEAVLDATLRQVQRNSERLSGEEYEHEWRSQTMMSQNPVVTFGLAQMTMGAPLQGYNGGLLVARVRYFDPERRRPGLPEEVAALVVVLEADRTVVELVNVGVSRERRVVLQAGAYREHAFTEVRCDGEPGQPATVDGSCLELALPPGAHVRLELGTRCYVNEPTYAFPWDGEAG